MKSVRWMMSYIIVAALGLWLAFAVSAKFMAPAHSQTPPPAEPPQSQVPPGPPAGGPSNGDLPPEFMNEVNQAQPGGAPPQAVPPPPAGSAQTAPPSIPPPPQGVPNAGPPPMGDAVTAPSSDIGDMLSKDNYIYDPNGKRDPFKPFKIIKVTRKETPADQLEPLQRWDLERLQIIGILWDVKTPRAMIKDPDGGVYTVTKSSRVGRNDGYISAIREGEVVVIETRYDEDKPIKESRIMEFKK
ncbi:pilus assembly protein PilP [Bdellovibrio sp. SKB1291214]|uniref:pilus assembly protein PilP n=1 Tax=Bdellovibrio sp. SKB1291214 TaxID=1732569 RepID=UPI000B51999C|nr:pilus assembly protein PilP [Bdellovibrio sp. SKB1291214]UYL08963.1 pilus assembly protein PilP [Bdellovibrio sp. SKB1291214]